METLNLNPPDCKKLVLILEDKNNYVVHYRNLQFYLKQGMKLKRVHRVLNFEQECWMKIHTDDVYKDIESNKKLYHTSDYPKKNQHQS